MADHRRNTLAYIKEKLSPSPCPLVCLSAVRRSRRAPPGTRARQELRTGGYFDKLNTSIGYDLMGIIAALVLIRVRERGKGELRFVV